MNKLDVNTGIDECPFNIKNVEKKYNAKWVGQFPLKTSGGGWSSDVAGNVFFQEVPPVAGYSQYFALIIQHGTAMITTGKDAVEGTIVGVVADDGEIIYSRYRHDYRVSKDGTVIIDGGRDYTKTNRPDKLINMKIHEGVFYQVT